MFKFTTELKSRIAEDIVFTIGDYLGTYVCDLAHEMFNNDYYIIGSYNAKEFLKHNFEDMMATLENYSQEFGTVYPDITDVEKLATLVALFVAEEVLNENSTVQEHWDAELTAEMATLIVDTIAHKYSIKQ